MEVIRATRANIAEVSRLFDLYRQFYKCDSDPGLANRFITERIENEESVIFVATERGSAKGFVQMYPSFCSVDACRILILHDLYVDHASRKTGIGKALMDKATEHARQSGASRLDLLTAIDNIAGQHLYEKIGYKKTLQDFYAYSLQL